MTTRLAAAFSAGPALVAFAAAGEPSPPPNLCGRGDDGMSTVAEALGVAI